MAEKEKTTPEAEEVKAEEAAPAEEKKEKKAKKLPKGALIAIIIAGVIVLGAAGFFGFAFMQDSAAKNAYAAKDYASAYDKAQMALFMDEQSKVLIEKAYIEEVLVKTEKRYFKAAEILKNSKMSAEDKNALFAKYNELAAFQVGQVITFAKYDQDNNLQNGYEDVEWIVLKVEQGGGRAYATLLSKNILGNPDGWNKVEGNTSYEASNLNDWCQTTFYNDLIKYMDSEEEAKMVKVNVKTGDETIQAKVFAPSQEEIEKYLTGDLAQYKKASVTKSAKNAGVLGKGQEATGAYYVRNAGEKDAKGTQWAAGYDYTGAYQTGFSSLPGQTGARVCITIDLGPVA